GVQVVDLAQARAGFPTLFSPEYWSMLQALNTDGQGFGQDAVVNTIPVKNAAGQAARLEDIKVADLVFGQEAQPVPFVTGELPLGIVNVQTRQTLSVAVGTADGASQLTYGNALAVGPLGARAVAVIAGTGKVANGAQMDVLAVVDVSNPASPFLLGMTELTGATGGGVNVIFKDNLVLVGTTKEVVVVNLSDPTRPIVAGTLAGVGGRLALGTGGNEGLLFGTAYSPFGGSSPLGGVRVATLGPAIPILAVEPGFALINEKNETVDDLKLTTRIVPEGTEVESATVSIRDEKGALLFSSSVPVSGLGETVWLKKQTLTPTPQSVV